MKIVIDIDEKDFEFIKSVTSIMKNSDTFQRISADLFNAVKSGEVAERPQGKWEKIKTSSGGYFECSKCHHCVDIEYNEINEHLYYIVKDNFCPNCGADMRGEAE